MTDNFAQVEARQVPEEARRRLVLAADAERRAIERELHGGVQQHLVALSMSLELAGQAADSDPDALRSILDEMRGDVQQASDDAARLAQRIYPAALELGGLAGLLRSAAVNAGVAARVDAGANSSYPAEIGMTVYLCWAAFLATGSDDEPVTITLREGDNALGFELVGNTADGDLDALQDRVEALGGRLTIEPAAASRVRLSGSLPLGR